MRLFPWLKHLKPLLLSCKSKACITQLHALMIVTGVVSANVHATGRLIKFYARIGDIGTARRLFDELPHREIDAWNSIIIAYSRRNCPHEALNLYHRMVDEGVRPDSSTFTVTLKACLSLMDFEMGEGIWRQAVEFGYERDVFVGSCVLNLYSKFGKMSDAMVVFDKMVKRDVVCWTNMIMGFAQNGQAVEAVNMYRRMRKEGVEEDGFAMAGLIQACANLGDSKLGLSVHGYMVRRDMLIADVVVQTGLLDMYAKRGDLESALRIFRRMPHKNAVSWGAMISGFAQNGSAEDALQLLIDMQGFRLKPDSACLVSALLACSQVGNLKLGKSVHGHLVRGTNVDQISLTALIDMYAKCGALSCARVLFDLIRWRDLILWNVIIASYGIHGRGEEAHSLFLDMRARNLKPDQATFASLLSAFSHSGLVEEGQYWFNVMVNELNIQPSEKHYACMVDLLSRAGRVEEAYQLIESMNAEPGLAIWVALLSGCHNYRKFVVGDIAARRILESNPDDLGVYALVANFLSKAGKWDEVAGLRKMMKNAGTTKIPGYSAVEVNGKHQTFLMEDKSHHQYDEIMHMLDYLDNEMRNVRFVIDTSFYGLTYLLE